MSLNQDIKDTIEKLKATDINGCITGSCLLDVDFDEWQEHPDIDVFVYSEPALVEAIMILEGWGFEPGGKDKTPAGERLKRRWIMETGVNRKQPLSTIMYTKDGVDVNITVKGRCESVLDVIGTFDMSIVMIGYDIQTDCLCDLRTQNGCDPKVAEPNKFRRHLYNHPSRFEVQRAMRQWNRVLKYWARGYDTRPMARFYLEKIDGVLEAGAIFGTDKDVASFEEMQPEFREMKTTIEAWLAEHEED